MLFEAFRQVRRHFSIEQEERIRIGDVSPAGSWLQIVARRTHVVPQHFSLAISVWPRYHGPLRRSPSMTLYAKGQLPSAEKPPGLHTSPESDAGAVERVLDPVVVVSENRGYVIVAQAVVV
jgi:hypothetical protein